MTKVTIYNEYVHERQEENVRKIYPEGIHTVLKNVLQSDEVSVKTVTLDTVNELTDELLDDTDVLIWWGHIAHDKVPDEVANRVKSAVHHGMGMIFLHSGHDSKPFKLLLGTPCSLGWREDGDRENLWVCNPSHPIAKGIDRYICLEHEETYCEPFLIPEPDELVFIGSYEGGEAFRSGCCFHRGYGRIFYFQPGHETYRNFYNPEIIKVIRNAVGWAKPVTRVKDVNCVNIQKISKG